MQQWIIDLVGAESWALEWIQEGMLCAQFAGGKAFELKDIASRPGGELLAAGCGGWDRAGRLHWVGLDLDVGHGAEALQYESVEEAIKAARGVREFCGGAAEIRRSKSGNGIHVRVKVAAENVAAADDAGVSNAGPAEAARKNAARIAKWIAKTLELKCDTSPLGRQNFWFWASAPGERGFELVAGCAGAWRAPAAAVKYDEKQQQVHREDAKTQRTATARTPERNFVLERASKYMAKFPPAISGQSGHKQAFNAASALVCGFDLSVEEARPIYQEYSRRCAPPWSDKEIEHKLTQAREKHRGERGWLLNAPNPKGPATSTRRPVAEPGGPETVIEIPDGVEADGRMNASASAKISGGAAPSAVEVQQDAVEAETSSSGGGGGGGHARADLPPPQHNQGDAPPGEPPDGYPEPMGLAPRGDAKRGIVANVFTEWRQVADKKGRAAQAATDPEVRKDLYTLRELDRKRLADLRTWERLKGKDDASYAPTLSPENSIKLDELVKKYECKREAFSLAKPMEEVRSDISAALNAWPQRLAWGVLFCDAGDGKVRLIETPVKLMALLKEYAAVKFNQGQDDDGVNYVKPDELFASFCQSPYVRLWKAVEEYPFEPALSEHYVTWRAPEGYEPRGEWFGKFLRMFTNVEDGISRAVFAAAICTPFWGGDYASRPAFVFGAKKPRSGKTTAAQVIGSLCGEVLMINLDRRAEERLKERMLSPEGLKKRVGLIDNLKGLLNSDLMEELVTTRYISGKVLGVGEGSRPNVMTYFVTANNAKLTPDFARRCFYCEFASPDMNLDWGIELAGILKHSGEIVADILWILRQPVPNFDPERKVKSEGFGLWIQNVLARVCQFADVADFLNYHSALEVVAVNQSRREDADQDREDAEALYVGVMERVVAWKNYNAMIGPAAPIFVRTEPPAESARMQYADDMAFRAAKANNLVTWYKEIFTRDEISSKWLKDKLEEHINAGRITWLRWQRKASARGWMIDHNAVIEYTRAQSNDTKEASVASQASSDGETE